jgi:hypothetical protein
MSLLDLFRKSTKPQPMPLPKGDGLKSTALEPDLELGYYDDSIRPLCRACGWKMFCCAWCGRVYCLQCDGSHYASERSAKSLCRIARTVGLLLDDYEE